MATKKTVKIDTKKIAKEAAYDIVSAAVEQAGLTLEDGADYGFKGMSLVIKGIEGHDICIAITAPKSGEETYDYRREVE